MEQVVGHIAADPRIVAAGIFAEDRGAWSVGLAADSEALRKIIATTRHLLLKTQPPAQKIEFNFARSRLVLTQLESVIVLLQVRGPQDVSDLLHSIVERVRAAQSQSHHRAPVDADRALSLLNRIVASARKSIGGPVIRNYLKKSRAQISTQYPSLDRFDVSLSGEVTQPPSSLNRDARDIESIGAWARAFVTIAATVAPDLHRLNVRELSGDDEHALDASGFFQSSHERTSNERK